MRENQHDLRVFFSNRFSCSTNLQKQQSKETYDGFIYLFILQELQKFTLLSRLFLVNVKEASLLRLEIRQEAITNWEAWVGYLDAHCVLL